MPEAIKPRYDLEKHKLRETSALMEFFERMILDYKTQKAQKPKGLHELREVPMTEATSARGDDEPEGNFLFELLLHAKETDIEKVLGPEELLTFQRWRAKGGGKGFNGSRGASSYGGKGDRKGAAGAAPSASPTGGGSDAFDGECGHCGAKGHRKRECPVLDKIMAERRAQGISPPRGEAKGGWQKGGGKGWGGKGQGGGWNGGKGQGQGKGTFQLEYPQIDFPPQGSPGVGPPGMNSMTAAQQWSSSAPGWGGRLCNVMERHDPRLLPAAQVVEERSFSSPNQFEVLAVDEAIEAPPVPAADPSWTRSRRGERFSPSDCSCCIELVSECVNQESALVAPIVSNSVTPEDSSKGGTKKRKKNKSSRNQTRKLIQAAAMKYESARRQINDQVVYVNDYVEQAINMAVPSWIRAGAFNYDSLVQSLGERVAMFEAKMNYGAYHKIDFDDVSDAQVRKSSAGVFGWSVARVVDWTEQSLHDLSRSSTDLPPATDDDRQGESCITTKSEDAPKSKPHLSPDAAVLAYSGELEGRERQLKMQQEAMDAGRLPIGMWSARETQQVLQE